MKFSSALAVFTASTVVSSHHILNTRDTSVSNVDHASHMDRTYHGPSYSGQNNFAPAGAAFFITNEADGNFIIGSDIGTDGKLTFKHAISAGGRGAHGVSNPVGGDPLFSQGAIKVAGHNVFTVNSASNTVSMFSIDPKDPAKLRMVGYPVSAGGEFPVSVAVSKKSGQVCVLNGGRVNGVNCFKQDPKLGLVQMSNTQRSLNLNLTSPPSGPPGTVSHIIFNEDGTELLVSVKGVPPMGGFIASWAVDSTSGVLSEGFIKSGGGGLPFSMTVIPGKNAILSTDPSVGFDIFNYKNKKQASNTTFPIKGQMAICWSSFSPKTGNFYLTDAGASLVTEVHIDNNLKGTIVKQYPQGNGSGTIDTEIATIGGKDFMYILAAKKQSVMVVSLNAPGRASPVQQFSFQNAVSRAGVKTSMNNVQGMAVFSGK